jgi:haloacetate dehalogenase
MVLSTLNRQCVIQGTVNRDGTGGSTDPKGAAVFEGFALERIDIGEVVVRVRHGGAGPAVLLLHGHPRTHTTWHRVAPLLAAHHTVVCPDLRGYGESSKPPTTADHAAYSKRAMARDCVALMRALGHEAFAVVGHDRGCYVAFRTAMDHPDAVTRLVVMDGVPIGEALARCDARFASSWWHWFFLGQTAKPAERVINADPDEWYRGDPDRMGAENHADYRRAVRDPATVHAMCEDYRAGLTVDREHDEVDRAAGRRVGCPTLFVWSEHDDMEELYGDPLAVWRTWARDVRGASIPSGHHVAEEAPEQLAAVLRSFLGAEVRGAAGS